MKIMKLKFHIVYWFPYLLLEKKLPSFQQTLKRFFLFLATKILIGKKTIV